MKKHLLMLLVAVMATAMSLEARITIALEDGFENGIQDSVWTQEFVVGNTPWAVESVEDGLAWPATVKQGSKRAYLRNTTGETQGYVTRLVSKVMDLTPQNIRQPELSFWYANPKWSADRDTLRVLYRTSPNAKWVQLAEYSTAMANWQKVTIEDLPSLSATYQIAFEGTDNLGRGIVLDSVTLRATPDCVVPHDITVSNKGANRVNIAWVASWGASFYELIVSKDTLNPYEVEVVPEDIIVFHGRINGLQQNYDLTLEAGEYYYVYLRSICTKENSLWNSEVSEDGAFGFRVRTSKQIPYTEDFNYPTAQKQDPEWTWKNNIDPAKTMAAANPYVITNTAASMLAKYSVTKTKAVVFGGTTTSASSAAIPAGSWAYLATPAMVDTLNENFHINQCQVRFWCTAFTFVGRQYGRGIMVGVMDDPDDITTFVPVDTVTIWGNQSFQENIVDLSSYQGTGAYVAFVSDFDRPNAFYMDDVTIEYRPEVSKVTEISVNPRDTFATISWKGNAASYNVLITNSEVDPSNPDPDAIIDQATVSSNSYVCEVLEADHSWNRPYYAYIQAVGAEWSYRYPFVTIASQRAWPYTLDFEVGSGRYKIGSTSYAQGVGVFGNDSKYPSCATSNVYKGSACLMMNKVAGVDAWITLPMVERLDSTQVKFYLNGSSASTISQVHATIGVMTNPMDINTFTKVSSFTLNSFGYVMCYANFRDFEGVDGVIAIVWDDVQAMTKPTLFNIDEVKVEKLSECVPPTNVELEVYSDSITVSWSASQNYAWEVLVSRSALSSTQRDKTFGELAALSYVDFADTLFWDDPDIAPEFTIDSLRSKTNYYMYIRTVCDGDAAWWTELSFSTPCPNAGFPYKETFESYSTGTYEHELGCWQMADYLGTGYPKLLNLSSGATSGNQLELWSTGTTHRNVAIMPPVEGNLSDMMLCFDTRSWSTTARSVVYVGTMRDINDESSFVPFDTIYNDGGNSFTRVRLVLNDYELTYDNIAFSSGLGTLQMASDVMIDNIELRDATCIEAYDFQQTAETATSVDFTWNGLSTNDQWELRVLNRNVTLANVAIGNYDTAHVAMVNDTIITGKSFHVEDMQPVSTYYVYIRALCGDSIWTMNEVQTACEKLDPSKPNKETFESYSGGTSYSANYQAQCWTVGNGDPSATTSYIPYIYNSSSYSYSGTKTYRMYGYAYYDYVPAYIVSPEIDITHMKELAISFRMYAETSYSWLCGVMTDPNDLSTFVVLDSVKGTGSSEAYLYDLSEYETLIPPTAKYFAWRTPYDATSYAYLDDVSISKMVCPFTKPSYSDLTASSVRISSGLRTDDEWRLLITNTPVDVDSLASPTYVVPATIKVTEQQVDVRSRLVTNLADQTTYYVYTATVCDSITSQWNSLQFTTPCLPLKPDNMGVITFSTDEGYVTGSGASRYFPCWTIGSKTPGLSASSYYYPYISTSDQHNGHNSMIIRDDASSNYIGAYAIMPEMQVDSIKKYQVSFWGRGYANTSYTQYNSQIIVGIVADPSDLNTLVIMDTINLSHTGWEPYSVGFENYEGDYLGNLGRYIMFLSDFGVTNYAYISEVSVELIPTCRPVSSFTVDSIGEDAAIVSWKGYQQSYRLLLSDRLLEDNEKPNYPYLLDSIVDHSDRIRLTGLNTNTNYYVYAQGICSDNDSTAISLQCASFRTLCPISTGVSLPFFDDFLSYEVGATDPGCWIFRGSSYSKIYSLTAGGKTYHAIDLYTSGSSNQGYIVVPPLAGNLEDMQVTFEARTYSSSETATATLYIGTMADPEDPTTFVAATSVTITGPTFQSYDLMLGDYNLPYDRLAFTSGLGSTVSSDLYITNIGLTELSSCHAPKMKVTESTSNTVELQITPSKPENNRWEIVVISDAELATIRNMDTYLKTADKLEVDTVFYTLTGLTPATTYTVYARTVCSEDEYSSWSKEPLKIHTQFYFKDGYFFGFEKSELWERSTYSTSDNYYLHPALVAGRDTLGMSSTLYSYYPYSMENTSSYLYSHTGNGALVLNASGNYHGAYVIFPVVDEAQPSSFEFKVRPGYVGATSNQIISSNDAVLEIGTVTKNKSFDTYQPMATIRLDKLATTDKALDDNNHLFQYFTLDLDSATMADKQIVLHSPQQPAITASLYIDDVTMGENKGFSLVAIKGITVNGLNATVEWENIGGPWNLEILDADGTPVVEYENLTATSQLVENLAARTEYTAVLSAASAPKNTDYTTSAKMKFTTSCQMMEPSISTGDFYWDFNNPFEWESNDVSVGVSSDSLYYQPSCFHVGITYPNASNGYQWLIQRKGYDYFTTAIAGTSYSHYEVGRNDSHALRVNTTSTYFNSYLVLPQLHCDLDTMMIEFYGRCFVNYDEDYDTESSRGKIVNVNYLGAGYSQSMVVGTLTDPNDFSTLQVLDTLTYRQTNLTTSDNVNDDPAELRYWELMQLPLTGAQGQYIVLFQPAPGLFILDDMSVKPIGSTLFTPTNTQTKDITATSATLSWNVKHPDLSSVVVVLNAAGDQEVLRDTVSGTVYALANLAAGTSYQWYVYQTNGANETPTTPFVQFATECVAITPAYSASFETEDGWTFIPGQSVYTQAVCWTYADALSNGWNASYDPQNIANTDALLYSHSGSQAVFLKGSYSSSYTSYQPYIAMPEMDITAYDTLQVALWMRPAHVSATTGKIAATYTGTSYSKSIIVGTMTDPENPATFVAIDTVTYDGTLSASDEATELNNYLYQKMTVELVGAQGQYVALMTSFYEKGGTSRKNLDYIYIDDIAFERVNDCKEPKALNADVVGGNFATLSWTAAATAQQFVLQVSTDAQFVNEEAFAFNDTVNATTYTVTGLTNLTNYYWRVQALCDGEFSESAFSQKATFKTSRSPYYYQNFTTAVSQSEWTFSSTSATNVVDGTGTIANSDNSYGFKRTTNNYGLEGAHYTSVGYLSDHNWMITPIFYLPADDSVHFSMDLALTACNTGHEATSSPVAENDMKNDYYFMIIVSEDGGATWKSENIIAQWQNTNAAGMQLRDIPSDGMSVRYSLAAYAGKSVRIGLYREATSSSNTGIAIHVDNIRLAYYDKIVDSESACQYEDINIGDIHLSGDETQPGIHIYPKSIYASDAEAQAGARDTVYQLEIEVFPALETVYADTICEGRTYTDINFHGKDRSGIYRRKLESIHGCDSIVTLNLSVTATTFAEDEEINICPGESYMWNDKPYNRAGIFRDTIVSAAGCDSVMTLIVSYYANEDTIFESSRVQQKELPFLYENTEYPYAAGQAPIYYATGTAVGTYVDTVQVQGENCNTVLVHTLEIYIEQGIDQVEDGENGARKVLYNDQMYIILNDEWYNAAGQKVADPRR